MPRELLFGQLDQDIACAVALGFAEHRFVTVNADAITLQGPRSSAQTKSGWLDGDDPLDVLTREYLTARRDAMLAGTPRPGANAWGASGSARKRDEANQRAIRAKNQARALLEERWVFARARAAGLVVLT